MIFKYSYVKILFDIVSIIKSNIGLIVMLFVLNLNSESTFIFWVKIAACGFILIGLVSRLIETVFTRVHFDIDGVRMYTGMFSKSERFIPRDKFENVQTEVTVLHRLFGAHKIVLETGEATGDVTLSFVKTAEIEKMRAYVLAHHDEATITLTVEDEHEILFTPTIKDILKAALTSFSFLAIIPITFNIWSDLKLDRVVDPDSVELPLWLTIFLIGLSIIAALIIGLLKTFNSYYQYKIVMDDERIYVKKGWLSKQTFSVRKTKVQAVIYKQNWYQKLLGVTTIKLVSTGEIANISDQQINEFFPYLPTKKADALVEKMLPQFARQPMTHVASKNAKKLIWLRPPLFAGGLALLGLWHWGFYIVAIVVLILTYGSRLLTYKNLAFTFDESLAQARSGGFSVETIVTKRSRLLEIKFTSSVLQRKCNTATMSFVNRAQPVYRTELLDIDVDLKPSLITWFEQRVDEVHYDPQTMDGALKKHAIMNLLNALATKKDLLNR